MTSVLRRVVRSPRLGEAALQVAAVAVAAVFVVIYVLFGTLGPEDLASGQAYYTGPRWLTWVIAAAIGLPLAVHRRWPEPAWAVVVAALTTATLLRLTLEPWMPAAIILYSIALRSTWRRAFAALATTLVLSAVAIVVTEDEVSPTVGIITYIWVLSGGAWTVGAFLRERRAAALETRRRAAEQALADERLQIARELHDVVAHSMSLIAVQAGVANHVVTQRPEAARDALRVIESTSRNALTDIRRLLGVLRTPDAEFAPTPGLAALPALIGQAVAGGIRVASDVRVDPRSHSDAVQLAAYRVVQEGLTNVLKHAGPTTCRVNVAESGGALRIVVEDDGPIGHAPDSSTGSGHGLIGLRERVSLFGGALEAGARPGGKGFRLVATLSGTGEES